MAMLLKQSTAVDVLIGPFVDATDGATAETGESPSVKLSKNGQTLAAKSDVTTPVHDADGYYNCELDTTDTNTVGTLVLTVAASANALPVRHEFQVVEEATYDFLYASGATPIADINAEVDTALTDYDAVVPADLPSNFADLSITATTGRVDVASIEGSDATDQINAACDTALTDYDAVVPGDLPSNFADMSITATTGLVDITQAAADKAWSTTTRVLTANTNLNDPTAAAVADAVWDEAVADHNTGGSFGQTLRIIKEGMFIREGTAQAGTASSITLDASASSTDEFYSHAFVLLVGGTGAGQVRVITAYNGTTKVATVGRNWTTNPDSSSEFQIVVMAEVEAKSVIDRVTANTDQIEGSDATDQIRDAILDDATRFSGADIATILTDTNSLNDTKVPDTISLANINAEVDTAIETYHLDHLLAVDYDPASKPGTSTALLNELVESDGGVSRFTANALEAITNDDTQLDGSALNALSANDPGSTIAAQSDVTGLNDPTAATIADAVWDEARSGHSTQGTYGESFTPQVSAAVSDASPSTTSFDTDLTEATNDHYNGLILAFVTGNLTGQKTDITDYDGTNKTVTVTALTEAPANGDEFIIY